MSICNHSRARLVDSSRKRTFWRSVALSLVPMKSRTHLFSLFYLGMCRSGGSWQSRWNDDAHVEHSTSSPSSLHIVQTVSCSMPSASDMSSSASYTYRQDHQQSHRQTSHRPHSVTITTPGNTDCEYSTSSLHIVQTLLSSMPSSSVS